MSVAIKRPVLFDRKILMALAVSLAGGQMAVGAELDEIIVTAQKREQSLQDVPIFVSVVSGDKLDASQIMNFNELSKLTPGLNIDGPIDGLGGSIRIRGIGVTKNIEGIRPSLGIFVDDVPLARIDNAFTNFADIDRIEVLKGPQATLFGKEVSAGAIVIHTKKPHTDRIDGQLELNAGNFDLQEYRGAINLPMGANVAARFSGYSTQRDSEIKNVITGDKGDSKTWGMRAQFLGKLSDRFEALLTVERHEARIRKLLREKAAYGTNTINFAAMKGHTLIPVRLYDRKVESDGGDGRDHQITNTALRLNWEINDNWSLTSISAYQKFDRDNDKSSRPGGVYYPTYNTYPTYPNGVQYPKGMNYTSNDIYGAFSYFGKVRDKVFTQELRVEYDCGPLSTIAGVFYEDARLNSMTHILSKSANPDTGTPIVAYGDRKSKNYAAFFHTIYEVDDHWTLTGGMRYSEVDKDDRVDNLIRQGIFAGTRPIAPPKQDHTWTAVSGTAKLSYKVSDDLTIYGGYDRGFKAGGHNTFVSGLPKFDDETVDSLELGVKGMALERSLRWSAVVFVQRYKDFQVNSPSTTGGSSYIQNAASVDLRGVEGELTWLVNDNFTIDAMVSYVDSKYDSFKHAECTDYQKSVIGASCTQDLSDKRVVGNAPLTWNLSGHYEAALGTSGWKWFARAEAVYRDKMEGMGNNDPAAKQKDYTLLNASLGLVSADGAWMATLWGKNLADKDYVAAYEVARDGLYGLNADLGDSRAYGVNLKYRF